MALKIFLIMVLISLTIANYLTFKERERKAIQELKTFWEELGQIARELDEIKAENEMLRQELEVHFRDFDM